MSDFTFSRRRDGSFQVDGYHGDSPAIAIPSEYEGKPVTAIADNAFSWSNQIRKVIIPDSVTMIGEAAFSWCESLSQINLPDSVRAIGEWAFIGCISLRDIHLPDGLKKIFFPDRCLHSRFCPGYRSGSVFRMPEPSVCKASGIACFTG